MIFGDIDSLSKHLTYQFSKDLLQNFSEPKINIAFSLLARKVEKFAVNYFEKNPSKLLINNGNVVVDSILRVHIASSIEHSWNSKTIKGSIYFCIKPNLKKEDKMFESFIEKDDFRDKINNISNSVFHEKLSYTALCTINFDSRVLFFGSYEHISIDELDLVLDADMSSYMAKIYKSFEKSISYYQKIIELINQDEIKEMDIDSEDFKQLTNSIKDKIIK